MPGDQSNCCRRRCDFNVKIPPGANIAIPLLNRLRHDTQLPSAPRRSGNIASGPAFAHHPGSTFGKSKNAGRDFNNNAAAVLQSRRTAVHAAVRIRITTDSAAELYMPLMMVPLPADVPQAEHCQH